jgi:hypothetical protein
VLSLVMSGVPAGATLSAGTRNANGTWTVAPADLPSLQVTPPRDFSGTMNLTLRATARDNDNSTATTSRSFAVRVEAVADAPSLRVGPVAGREDEAIGLRVSAATTDVDGSERIAGFRLLDVPEGAVVRAGGAVIARQPDGSVLVDAAAAPTLSVTPPPDSDRDFTLRVTAISEEPNGSRAESAPRDLPVRVDAVADAPVWIRLGAAGEEDGVIPLGLSARLPDADGSEALSFVVSGLPAGAVLSHGTYRGPGSWSLTAAEAALATLTPPRDFAGTLNLTATAVAQEADGGHQATTTVTFPVHVTAVVDTADWAATARGAEDEPIALRLAPPLRDADGSERLVGDVLVEGVPEGAVLRLADGSAVAVSGGACAIPVAQLAGLTILMPGDSDVAARLHVTVTVEDAGGVRALVRGEVTVDPLGVADMPALRVTDVTMAGHASGQPSEGWAALPIAAAVTDTDGSETAHVWVRDVPEGFRLSAGTPAGSGAWLLREADLPGLSIRPPAGYEGEVVLRVTAVAVEREGDTEQASATLTFRVEPPAGGGGGGGGTGGSSDGGGILPGDPPPAPPTLSVTDGSGWEDGSAPLPVAAAAAPGTALGLLVRGVPAGARLSAGIHDAERDVWVLRPEELDGLRVIPAPDFAGEVALRITAIAVGATGATASDEAAATLRIEAVADGPALSAAPDAGVEDREVPLNLAIAAADVDGSERVVAITLSGLPRGATIAPAPGVRDNGDGTWSVDPAAAGLARLVPPPDAHGTFSLTVTATTEEASNGAQATASRGITVAVAPAPDAPVAAAADAAGQEDRPIALALSAALADADGSEALSVVVSGLPEGARLSAGINNGDGSWTLTPGQLAGLTVTPPQDWSGSMALTMRAHAMERSTREVATTEVAFRVAVAGVADAPLVDAAATAAGAEDAPIGLDILARLTDTDGSEQLVLLVTGVPAGAAFSAGSANADGSWTIPGAALPGLTFTPPRDYAGTLRLEFAATAQEAEGGSAATRFQIAVTVDPVADAPTLSLAAVQGAEDSWIRLPIAATLTDTDGSEGLARFLVSGLPAGATLSHGTAGAGGVWTLTPAQAAVVSMRPSANWSGTADLSVTAISREAANGSEAGTTARLSVTVTPVADAPILTLSAAQGAEDTAIRLPIAATLTDTDGSEGIARFLVSGLPAGATLSQGTADAGGVWTLTPAQAAVVTMTPPANWSGTASLSVTAVSREAANGAEASSTLILPVTIAAVADGPVLAAADASGLEDQSVALSLSAALGDLDGSERFAAIQVTGLPPGFALSAGTPLGDGAWALALSDFDGLRLTAPADWNGTLSLALVATAQDGTSTATASRTFSVTLAPVNDAPSVALFGAPGAATGQDRVALLEGATIADVDSPRMGGATITLAGAQPGDRLVFDGEPLREEGGRTLLGDTGIEVAAAPDGTVTLSGSAPVATYARVLETLVLESPDGLAAGTRTIGVTLRDEAGAAASTQVVGLTVDPSVIMGGESGGILAGTAGHDTFIGGTGDETMQGGAGADLFVVAMDGSADQIDGGAGSWTDTVKVQGAGAPGQGGWTLVIEGDTAMTALDRSFDFAQPVSGHIQFADGTQVDLIQIERISW